MIEVGPFGRAPTGGESARPTATKVAATAAAPANAATLRYLRDISCSLCVVVRSNQPRIFGVLLDVVRDERAERNDVKSLAACVVQRRSGETAAEATPLPRLVDLGVREGDPAVPAPVSGKADQSL